ncbi:MAG: D-erythronate dehydrogenase [Salinisphaera sp.]|uniref:D-erythronate dehydrogenase n=1 Tax=Salinisphaera sp. TaxID=1914330 RepID=UPI003C7B4986
MRVLVTGGAGFLGTRLIQTLLDSQTTIGGESISAITSLDMRACPVTDSRVTSVVGDGSDGEVIAATLTSDTAVVCHLAAVVSSEAEADFDRGMQVNLDATRQLLDACRGLPRPPRFLFASSLAVFGPDGTEPLAEDVAPMPQSSYGTQKAIGELLVNDYSRKGFIDGRACRLPTIVVRPGRPNRAASSFASSIIREPLAGVEAICPVGAEQSMWLSSPRSAVANLIHALELPAERLGSWRTINLPGLSVTVTEMLDALARRAGREARALVRFETDPDIERLVKSWPGALDVKRPYELGFRADEDFDAAVAAFIEDEAAAGR